MESNFKEGDVVVILEAYPENHNGKVAIYLGVESVTALHVVRIPNFRTWNCVKIRHATLLEKELAEVWILSLKKDDQDLLLSF